ncbi:MAG: hypothetical protein CML13_08455 [Puniceicoccaceae bacterium]|nr:hypothetical protein [Puniceicoccaceae bacterium]|tara:strand:- start:6476 stop:7066 length:591 start_codon:yes stop_codon:yes gene_type:complete
MKSKINELFSNQTSGRLTMLSCFLLVALITIAQAESESLIRNPLFSEDANADGWPDSWGKLPGASWLKADEGFPFMRLEQKAPGEMRMIYLKVPIPAGASEVVFSGKVRAEAVVPGDQIWFDARIISQYIDVEGKKMNDGKPRPYIIAKKGTCAWKEFEYTYPVPEGAAFFQIMAGHFQTESGTVDLAELSLRVAE